MGLVDTPMEEALLQSLREGHAALLSRHEPTEAPLTPLELADLLWLARRVPSTASVVQAATEPLPKPADEAELLPTDGPFPSGDGKRRPSRSSAPDPLRRTLPTFFPPAPPRAASPDADACLLPDAILPSEADVQAALPLRLQDVRLIRAPQPLQGALATLGGTDAGTGGWEPRRLVVDEVATVEAYARSQRLWPLFRRPREPRLSLLLLVDRGLSMEVWQRLAAEWLALLTRSGAFRDVRALRLDPERPAAALGAPAGEAGEQVVWLLSDCSGQHWWHGGAMHGLLKRLARRTPLAIVQVLPEWMWRRTALGIGTMVAVRNRQPFAANGLYSCQATQPWESPPRQGDRPLVLPVLSLSARSLAGWSRLLLGRGNEGVAGVALPALWPEVRLTPTAPDPQASDEDQARRRVRRFLQRSSLAAEELLRVMAAAPVLTLPVMRLLQEEMVPGGGPQAMAELLLSGLIRRLEPAGPSRTARRGDHRQADRISFAFQPGVRSVLLETLSVPDTAEVVQRVSKLIEARWDQCEGVPPFRAFLANPSLLVEGDPLASFARVTASIIARLPGAAYQQLAESLRRGASAEPTRFPPEQFPFEEIDLEPELLLPGFGEPVELDVCTVHIAEVPLEEHHFDSARWRAGEIDPSTGTAPGFTEDLGPAGVDASADIASLTLLHIPSGSFTMGSPDDEPERYDDEGPQHTVCLREFFLSRTPVTQAQWRAVAEWTPREEEAPWLRELDPDPVGTLGDGDRFGGEQRPVVNVSWHDAMEFCRRLRVRTGKNYTLPSEAQWEYACRAGTTTPFHFGETITPKLANYDGTDSYANGPRGENRRQTTDVGLFPANAWGLRDMHGTVWEWCLDDWQPNYEGAPEDGSAWLIDRSKTEKGKGEKEEKSTSKLLRGGSWINHPRYCRSACRSGSLPGNRDDDVGFRVCCLPQDVILYS